MKPDVLIRALSVAGLVYFSGMPLFGCATTNGFVADTAGVDWPQCEWAQGTTARVSHKILSGLMERELLVCPDGATARPAPREDTAGSIVPPDNAPLTIDIVCPGVRYSFDTDDARSARCIPPPLTVLSAEVAGMMEESTMQLKAGKPASAARIAGRAASLQPGSESILATLGTAQMASGRFKDAEKTFAKALEINPGAVPIRLAHAVCLSETGEKAMYAAEIFRLYDEVPASNPLHWELTCRVADNFNRIGNRQEAIRLARVACEHGVDMCCDLARSDIDAREVQ